MRIAEQLSKLAVPIDSLHEDPNNVRVHDERSIASLAAALEEFGQQKPIVALHGGKIIAGNGTWRAAKKLGAKSIAVVRFDDEEKARAFAIADNRMSDLSRFDEDALAKAINELQISGYGPEPMGFDAEEMTRLIAGIVQAAPTDAESPTSDPAAPPAMPGAESTSNIRMVQLFLNGETEPVFMRRLSGLGGIYDTGNITDTVFEAVAREATLHGLEGDGSDG